MHRPTSPTLHTKCPKPFMTRCTPSHTPLGISLAMVTEPGFTNQVLPASNERSTYHMQAGRACKASPSGTHLTGSGKDYCGKARPAALEIAIRKGMDLMTTILSAV